jgi:hypothetical protein
LEVAVEVLEVAVEVFEVTVEVLVVVVEVLEVAVELGRKPSRVLWVIPMLQGLMAVLVAVVVAVVVAVLVELAMKSSEVLCVNDFVFEATEVLMDISVSLSNVLSVESSRGRASLTALACFILLRCCSYFDFLQNVFLQMAQCLLAL